MKRESRRSTLQASRPRENYSAQKNRYTNQYENQYTNPYTNRYRNPSSDYYMYSANAVAREYQYEEEVRPVQKTVKKQAKRHLALTQHFSTILIVFLLGLALVCEYTVVQGLGYQVSQTKSELKTVQEQNEKLKKQIATLGELQNVEAIAMSNMGMRKPEDWEVIYLPQGAPAESEEEANGLDKAVEQVKEVIGTISASKF